MFLNLTILILFLFILIFSISKWKVHPFIALILTALALGMSLGMGGEKTVEVLLKGFSETMRWIAIVIILGAFIGEILEETGGAFRISNSIIKRVGEKQLPWAMASLLGVNMGRMLMINVFVALFAMVGGVLWVKYSVKNAWIDYDKKLSEEAAQTEAIALPEKEISNKNNLLFDILPILVPIVLISLGSFAQLEAGSLGAKIFKFISIPLVAVLIGAFIAIFQLKTTDKRSTINRLVEQAITKSALVIMITAAGGSLGFVIRETGIQNEIVQFFANFPFLGIMLPFLVASMLTISTGSITVSLVATASMIGPIVHTLPVSPEMVAALIGCGSFCVFHANSSFFWLLNRLHEVPPNMLYKTYTVQSLIMGLSGLIGVFILKMLGF